MWFKFMNINFIYIYSGLNFKKYLFYTSYHANIKLDISIKLTPRVTIICHHIKKI